MAKKKILCLDFDGVCHSYVTPWTDVITISDPPVPGLFEFLEKADKKFNIHIFSSRSRDHGGIVAMENWFNAWWPSHIPKVSLTFPIVKPPAFIGLDDRVLNFTGSWPDVEEMENFRPWNKRE